MVDDGVTLTYICEFVIVYVRLETFFELNCSDSMKAWPIITLLQQYYCATALEIVIQQLLLPYHRDGFLTTQVIN